MDKIAFVGIALLCTLASAQAEEFPVDTRTSGSQCNPAVAMNAAGQAVVVWSSYYSSAGRSNDVLARRFGVSATPADPNGNPLTEPFQVNATSEGNQTAPAVTMDETGYCLVVWQGPGVDAEDIFARLFDPNGQGVTEEQLVNTDTAGRQLCPRVAFSVGGTFAVVWESRDPDPNLGTSVKGQILDPNGRPIGPELAIDEPLQDGRYPDVAMDARGGLAVTWLQDRSRKIVFARLFDPNGAPTTEPFEVSTAGIASVTGPSIAMTAGGDFVIAWDGDPNRASDDDVAARCYEPNGAPAGDPFVVNTIRDGAQQWPRVAMNDTGEFVVVWQHLTDDPNRATDIFARRFDSAAVPAGDAFQLNTYEPDKQRYPDVGLASDGSFLAVWESEGQDGSDYGLFARVEPPAASADLNGDGSVDLRDLACLARGWRSPTPAGTPEPYWDGAIDARDLERLCRHWLR